jgi:hypothetical protein
LLRDRVSSAIIASIGYDRERNLLEVEFNNGWIYEYRLVPPEVYHALMAAPSKGRYLHQSIVDRYPTIRTR